MTRLLRRCIPWGAPLGVAALGYLLDGGWNPTGQLAFLPLLAAIPAAIAAGTAISHAVKSSDSGDGGDATDPNKNRPDFYTPPVKTGAAGAAQRISAGLGNKSAQQALAHQGDPRYGTNGLLNRSAFAPTHAYNWGNLATAAQQGSAGTAQDVARSRSALDMLQQAALGHAPSVAEAAAQRALGRGQAAIAAQAASVPGGYNPAAMRTAQYASRDLAQRVAGQASLNAMKEQAGYRQLFARMAAQRAADQGRLELGRGALGAQYRQLGYAEQQANRNAQENLMRLLLQKYLGERGVSANILQSARQRDAAMVQGGLNAGASVLQGIGMMA